MPVRIGYPKGITGISEVINDPMYSTAVGLVKYGAREGRKKKKFRIRDTNIFSRIINTMKKWFSEVF